MKLSPRFSSAYEWTVKNPRFTWMLTGAILFALLFWAVLDRDDPVVFTGPTSIPQGRVGEEITFDTPIDRHLARNCDAVVQRTLIDSTGAMRSYGNEQDLTAEARKIREDLTPGRLRVSIVIPPTLTSGNSLVLNQAKWFCPRNPTTYWFPIRQTYTWKFVVLVPQPAPPPIVILPPPTTAPPGTPSLILRGEIQK